MARISEFCRKWNITELAVFGSVLRSDFGAESDIDLLAIASQALPVMEAAAAARKEAIHIVNR